MEKKRALLLFVDGFGLGKEEKWSYNPIETGNLPVLQSLLKNGGTKAVDATLGVLGTPQSASGQTTILTGVNGPKSIGKHLNGFPNEELRNIIKKDNIFMKLQVLGLKVNNANAYNEKYLSGLLKNSKSIEEMSVSTVATLSAGLSLHTEEDLRKETAVYQDLTNQIISATSKTKIPIRTPWKAGKVLGKIVENYDFTFFEYFQTDLAGHRKDFNSAYRVLEELDQFIGSLLESLSLEDTLFVLVSDHGNIEDLSTPYHTMNKVPVIALGMGAEYFLENIRSIQDITPKIEEYFLRKNQTS